MRYYVQVATDNLLRSGSNLVVTGIAVLSLVFILVGQTSYDV